MGWTNYHGHCNYCDGHGKIEEYIQQAIKNKMPVIGFSSHAPVPFDCFWTMKEGDLTQYLQELDALKKKYSQDITVLCSLEMDYIPEIGGFNPFLNEVDLDYKIGSIHFMGQFKDGEYWAIDGSFDEFKKGYHEIFKGDIQLLVKRFFQLNREMIKKQNFEIIGHLDKIKMHNLVEPLFNEHDAWYRQEINTTLDLIAEKNIIVEINTKSYESNGILFPGVDLFPLLKQRNISVTINSDSHYPGKQQCGFTYVAEELYRVGYRYLREYKDGQWIDLAFNKSGLIWE
jgi:histidinol-phosphatase (PHP family)